MTTHREYDSANRLRLIESRTNGVPVCSFTYDYNLANQRTRATAAPEATRWDYTYDALGQVTSGLKRWSDSNWVAGARFNYGFDTIGNRLWTEAGGDAAGTGLRHAAYTNNLLNQITARDVPGAADVTGSAHPQVAVTVNGSTANRHSDYYHQVLTWNNATGAVWAAVTNRAQCQGLSDTSTGHLLLPQTPETFLYDQDGNLLQDGLWNYTWDAENRLTRMVSRTNTPSASWQALDFCYDWLGRRVGKVVSRWNEANQTYEPSGLRIYCYAGWNLQVEMDETGYPARSFTWGTDASGTPQGAGGVGGLLSMTIHRGTNAGTYFYCYDGNWNVVALVNAATGEVAAQYDYGPFHELLRATGPVARENPFLAATKYYDWETGLYYYGFRYYSAGTGRWLSRDPVAEAGGFHLYGFCANNPVRYIDAYGRDITDWTWVEPAADFAAGVSDSLTMGITSWFRGKMAIDAVDYSSGLYYVGETTEFLVETTITLGGGALRRKALQYSGDAGRYFLAGNYRKNHLKSLGYAKGKVKGGIVHHWNPIRDGRFPLPYRWAGRNNWNLTFLQDGASLTADQKHRFLHWYLKMLDTADVARAWSSVIRTAGNAIIQYVNTLGVQQNGMGNCPAGPDLTIDVEFSATLDAHNEAFTDTPDSPEFPPVE